MFCEHKTRNDLAYLCSCHIQEKYKQISIEEEILKAVSYFLENNEKIEKVESVWETIEIMMILNSLTIKQKIQDKEQVLTFILELKHHICREMTGELCFYQFQCIQDGKENTFYIQVSNNIPEVRKKRKNANIFDTIPTQEFLKYFTILPHLKHSDNDMALIKDALDIHKKLLGSLKYKYLPSIYDQLTIILTKLRSLEHHHAFATEFEEFAIVLLNLQHNLFYLDEQRVHSIFINSVEKKSIYTQTLSINKDVLICINMKVTESNDLDLIEFIELELRSNTKSIKYTEFLELYRNIATQTQEYTETIEDHIRYKEITLHPTISEMPRCDLVRSHQLLPSVEIESKEREVFRSAINDEFESLLVAKIPENPESLEYIDELLSSESESLKSESSCDNEDTSDSKIDSDSSFEHNPQTTDLHGSHQLPRERLSVIFKEEEREVFRSAINESDIGETSTSILASTAECDIIYENVYKSEENEKFNIETKTNNSNSTCNSAILLIKPQENLFLNQTEIYLSFIHIIIQRFTNYFNTNVWSVLKSKEGIEKKYLRQRNLEFREIIKVLFATKYWKHYQYILGIRNQIAHEMIQSDGSTIQYEIEDVYIFINTLLEVQNRINELIPDINIQDNLELDLYKSIVERESQNIDQEKNVNVVKTQSYDTNKQNNKENKIRRYFIPAKTNSQY